MVLVEVGLPEGLEVHQLLCGRDIAIPGGASDPQLGRIFGFAAQMANYVYVIIDRSTQTATVIDPAWDIPGLFKFVAEQLNARITSAFYTHRHYDHTGGKLPPRMTNGNVVILQGLREMIEKGCTRNGVGKDDAEAVSEQTEIPMGSIEPLLDGQLLPIGELSTDAARLQVIHTPGHTPGSVCFLLTVGPANSTPLLVLTGDTLFIGSSGRVDLPESDPVAIFKSLARLATLDENVVVLPGHNYARPTSSTVGNEKQFNMMMMSAVDKVQSGTVQAAPSLKPNPIAATIPLPDYLSAATTFLDQCDGELEECHKLCCGKSPILQFSSKC